MEEEEGGEGHRGGGNVTFFMVFLAVKLTHSIRRLYGHQVTITNERGV